LSCALLVFGEDYFFEAKLTAGKEVILKRTLTEVKQKLISTPASFLL
jgi:hypothetical protein